MPEKFSRKREALYNALRATTVHPTAEWLYAALRPEYPDLSLGTVYRNLKKFCAEGKARSVGVINGQEHFDGDTSAHSHFVCDCCGRVLDIFEPLVDTRAHGSRTRVYNHKRRPAVRRCVRRMQRKKQK